MPPPSDSTPHDQKDNSARDVQHGIAAIRGLWPFEDFEDGGRATATAVSLHKLLS
jgi:hypothetical protein